MVSGNNSVTWHNSTVTLKWCNGSTRMTPKWLLYDTTMTLLRHVLYAIMAHFWRKNNIFCRRNDMFLTHFIFHCAGIAIHIRVLIICSLICQWKPGYYSSSTYGRWGGGDNNKIHFGVVENHRDLFWSCWIFIFLLFFRRTLKIIYSA